MLEDGRELRFYCHPRSNRDRQAVSVYQYTLSSQYFIDWEIGSSRFIIQVFDR